MGTHSRGEANVGAAPPPLKVKALQFIHPYATIVSIPIQCYNSKLSEYATIVSFPILTICDDGG